MDLTLIQKELDSTLQRLDTQRQINERLKSVRNNLADLYQRQKKLDKSVRKEKREYESLENRSLNSLFTKVLGNHEEKLEKERQEYLDAVLKFNEAVEEIELLEYEEGILKTKHATTADTEKELKNLLAAKEKSLLASAHPLREELIGHLKRAEGLERYRNELHKTLAIGQELKTHLERILHNLRKARDWGQQSAGSRMARHQKYGYIDRAHSLLYSAKRHMQLYEQQIAYVFEAERISFAVEFPDFNSFSDVFFQNLISDWIFVNKVQATISQITAVASSVRGYNSRLEKELKQVHKEAADVVAARQATLLKEV